VRVVDSDAGALVQIDNDGTQGPAVFRTLVTLPGVVARDVGAEQFLF
jgi:hypothetical protein